MSSTRGTIAKLSARLVTTRRKYVIYSVWLALAIGLTTVCLYKDQALYSNCSYYTKLLNGGTQKIGEKNYQINLCGRQTNTGGTKIRLDVLAEQGELLARRYFSFYWNDASEKELAYSEEAIIYYDNSQDVPLKAIDMPPTLLDWLSARVPSLQ